MTPIHLAIQNNHFNIGKTLVKYGVNVNEFSLIRQSSSDPDDDQNRIPEGHFNHVRPPLRYSPIQPPIYQGPDLRGDIDDDDNDVPANQ